MSTTNTLSKSRLKELKAELGEQISKSIYSTLDTCQPPDAILKFIHAGCSSKCQPLNVDFQKPLNHPDV